MLEAKGWRILPTKQSSSILARIHQDYNRNNHTKKKSFIMKFDLMYRCVVFGVLITFL